MIVPASSSYSSGELPSNACRMPSWRIAPSSVGTANSASALGGLVDLRRRQRLVAVGGGDEAALDRGVVELLEAVLGADEDVLVDRLDEQEGERAVGLRPGGRDREVVAGRVGRLHHGGADDLRDRLLLRRAGAVAEVGERHLRRRHGRVDDQRDEQQRAGQQVLRRQAALGRVGREDRHDDEHERHEVAPAALGQQRREQREGHADDGPESRTLSSRTDVRDGPALGGGATRSGVGSGASVWTTGSPGCRSASEGSGRDGSGRAGAAQADPAGGVPSRSRP